MEKKNVTSEFNTTDPFIEPASPTASQQAQLAAMRSAAKIFAEVLNNTLPTGPDKSFVFRTLRTAVMWASVAIMRNVDGSIRN